MSKKTLDLGFAIWTHKSGCIGLKVPVLKKKEKKGSIIPISTKNEYNFYKEQIYSPSACPVSLNVSSAPDPVSKSSELCDQLVVCRHYIFCIFCVVSTKSQGHLLANNQILIIPCLTQAMHFGASLVKIPIMHWSLSPEKRH